jgi:hypothetical protein
VNQHATPLDARPDSLNAARQHLARVIAWPNDGETPSYINIHWTFQGENFAKPAWTGRACTSVTEAAKSIEWALKQKDVRDVYVCMSSQSQAEERVSAKGFKYRVPIRSNHNAVALKSFFIDLDAKGEDKDSYADIPSAAAALSAFIKAVGLPKPSMMVSTGGGLHIYWVVARALTPDEWKPIALALAEAGKRHGLKFDSQCTVDSARILRVPDTFNRKLDQPRPVKIAGTPTDFDYSLERIAKPLEPYKVAVPTAAQPASFLENPALFAGRKPLGTNELGAGIEEHTAPPVDLDEVAKECQFVRDAVTHGGKDYANPLWNLTTLISTFTAGGRGDAHRMGDKHPGYNKDETDAQFDRKTREKAEKNLGWPSCQTISGAGCKACASCPHFAAAKSPLHLGLTLPAQVTIPTPSITFVDPWSEFIGPPFPLKYLPLPLANFVEAEHEAMGVDPSALAMAALAVVAGAMNAETCARAGDAWYERPILWLGLIGPPSAMKSPTLQKATAPLRAIDHQRDGIWRQQYAYWTQTKQNKTAGTNPGLCPMKPGRLVIQDATPEKAVEILSRDSAGSLMLHDELAGWLGSFERYNSGQSSRAFFLSSWNGGPYLKDRVGQGARDEYAETRVDNLALGIIGGIQPDRLTALRDLTSDGLLQRFLPVLMRAPKRGDENYPVVAAEKDYAKLIRVVHGAVPRRYEFAPDAIGVRKRVLDRLYRLEQIQGFASALTGAIGKLRGYYVRLALTLHVAAEHASVLGQGSAPPSATISRATAEATESLLFDFLLPHIFGLYDVISSGGKERDTVRAIASFILASDSDRFRPSDITAGVRKLRGQSHKEIADWASRFCAMGWLRPEDESPALPKAWLVTPGLREHFVERRTQAQQARAEAHAILSAGGTRK